MDLVPYSELAGSRHSITLLSEGLKFPGNAERQIPSGPSEETFEANLSRSPVTGKLSRNISELLSGQLVFGKVTVAGKILDSFGPSINRSVL